MLSVLNFQCLKAVLVLDSSGALYLSIPSNASCHSYTHSGEKPVVAENAESKKQSFPYKGASGILSYKQGSNLQSIVVTVLDKPEVKQEKTLRFSLEASSLVPTGMSPGKYTNITEISLNLTTTGNGSMAMNMNRLPAASALSRDPVQLLNQLTSGGKPPKKPGCCDVQASTYDPSKGTFQTQQLSQSSRINPELDMKIKEATERMLRAPLRQRQIPQGTNLPGANLFQQQSSQQNFPQQAFQPQQQQNSQPQQQSFQQPQQPQNFPQLQQPQQQNFTQPQQQNFQPQQGSPAPSPAGANAAIQQALQSLQALTQQSASTSQPLAALQQNLQQAMRQQGTPQPQQQNFQPQQQQMNQQQNFQPQQQNFQQQVMNRQPGRTIADRFNTAQQLANLPSHSQPLGRSQQPRSQSQASPAGQGAPNPFLAGLASIPGMAGAMNNAMAQGGEAPSKDQLMQMADEIMRKAKTAV